MRILIVILIFLAGCTIAEKQPEQEQPKPVRITLAFTGDMMLHRSVYRSAWDDVNHAYDFFPIVRGLKGIVDSADIAVCNLETVLAGTEIPYSGYPRFNSPDHILTALDSCGFDILQTANNHCLDYSLAGLKRTITKIRETGLKNCGTVLEQDSLRFLIKETHGVKIGFLAFTYGSNGNRKNVTANSALRHINYIDDPKLETYIRQAAKSSDFLIVLPHWGIEYATHSNELQRTMAKKIVECGADLIVGTHPHVIQENEIIDGVPVFYSLGNCVSSQLEKYTNTIETQTGVVLLIELECNDDIEVATAKCVPLWMHAFYDTSGIQYEILPIETSLHDAPYRFAALEKQKMHQAAKKINEHRFPSLINPK